MLTKMNLLAKRARQKGLTTVEYAVAGALIALAVVTAFTDLGTAVGGVITDITAVL
jgi:pilus assembly protein Flp/PilA